MSTNSIEQKDTKKCNNGEDGRKDDEFVFLALLQLYTATCTNLITKLRVSSITRNDRYIHTICNSRPNVVHLH
eukprot:m.69515 g.69515  ORF g.69515 m.69515 type:complete len:73 (+) comp8278_c0_seq8:466-684(+)